MSWRRDRAHYRELKAQGRCVICAARLRPGETSVRCGACNEKRNEQRRQLRRQWMAAGLCRTCGAEILGDHTRCEKCLKEKRESNARKREKGSCG